MPKQLNCLEWSACSYLGFAVRTFALYLYCHLLQAVGRKVIWTAHVDRSHAVIHFQVTFLIFKLFRIARQKLAGSLVLPATLFFGNEDQHSYLASASCELCCLRRRTFLWRILPRLQRPPMSCHPSHQQYIRLLIPQAFVLPLYLRRGVQVALS